MTPARKKIPLNAESSVLTKSRRRCCLCAHVDGDWSAKLGQIAHLDQDPSNNTVGNLAFLCLQHHSTYDSKTSQHKNFTEAEVRHWRDELYRALTTLPTPMLPNLLPISGARADERRARDLENIKTALRSIHWPSLDNHIQELPLLIFDPIFHFWEGFNGVVSSSLFHIYDSSAANAIRELHRQWSVTVSFGIHYMPKGNGSYIFANPDHRPLTDQEERDWEKIRKAALALANAKRILLDHIRRAFEEVDIEKLSNEAWSEYSAFQNRFSKLGIDTRDAKNEEQMARVKGKKIVLPPAVGTGHAVGNIEWEDGTPWQQFSSDFAKLSEDEKGKRRLGVIATQEPSHSDDVAIWGTNGGYSENFKARFELLASQAGNSLGPLPAGTPPFFYWLHRLYQHLREERSELSTFQIYTTRTDDGGQVSLECPLIESVCEASSTFCLRLQKRKLDKSSEGKEVAASFQNWIENNHISASVPAQISERNRVSLVAESAQTPIPIEFLSCQLQEIKLSRGSTEFGSPRKFLDIVAEAHGLVWAITQRGLWMARQPPSAGEYIDANGIPHNKPTIAVLPSEDTLTRRTAEVLNILIASPSDVADERNVAERVILDWNASHLDRTGVMLHPVRWESHAYPASGSRPQGILNKQIVESGDVLIGIFGYKLGTPTGKAQSGTIEEIEEFRKAGKHVALYFSSADIPRNADRSQLDALESYKKQRQKDTLYFEFEDAISLRNHLTRQLPMIVEEVRRKLKKSGVPMSHARNVGVPLGSHVSAASDVIPTSRLPLLKSYAAEIEPLDVETRPVHLDESEIWRIGQVEGWGAQAILLPFYLDPRKSSPGERVEYAMAHLVFVCETSVRTRIAHGCWINASLDCIEMRPGETKYLILAIGSRDLRGPFLALSTNRTSVGWEDEAGGKAFEDFELSPGKFKVEITLTWGGNSEFRKTFELSLTIP